MTARVELDDRGHARRRGPGRVVRAERRHLRPCTRRDRAAWSASRASAARTARTRGGGGATARSTARPRRCRRRSVGRRRLVTRLRVDRRIGSPFGASTRMAPTFWSRCRRPEHHDERRARGVGDRQQDVAATGRCTGSVQRERAVRRQAAGEHRAARLDARDLVQLVARRRSRACRCTGRRSGRARRCRCGSRRRCCTREPGRPRRGSAATQLASSWPLAVAVVPSSSHDSPAAHSTSLVHASPSWPIGRAAQAVLVARVAIAALGRALAPRHARMRDALQRVRRSRSASPQRSPIAAAAAGTPATGAPGRAAGRARRRHAVGNPAGTCGHAEYIMSSSLGGPSCVLA